MRERDLRVENAELRAENERLTLANANLLRVARELTEGHKRECYAKLDAEVERDEALAGPR